MSAAIVDERSTFLQSDPVSMIIFFPSIQPGSRSLGAKLCPIRNSISARALSYKPNAGDFLRLLRLGGKAECQERSA